MRVLYVTGDTQSQEPTVALSELAWLDPGVEVVPVAGGAAALVEIRTQGGFQAVFISPDLPHSEALALIATLRRDRAPVAIVVIITEAQRPFFGPALTAGADDVLVAGVTGLVAPQSTAQRVRYSRYVDLGDDQEPLAVVYVGEDDDPWRALDDTPFVAAQRSVASADGACDLEVTLEDGRSRPADVLVVDDRVGDPHALEVVKWLHATAPHLPVIVLSSPNGGDIASAAIELGADDVVVKTASYRRRLAAALHRVYQRGIRIGQNGGDARRASAAPPVTEPAPAEDLSAPLPAPQESAELAILRATNESLEERLAIALAELESNASELAGLTGELDTVRRELASQQEALGASQRVDDAYERELDAAARELASLRRAHEALQVDAQALRRSNEELKEARAFGDAMRGRDRDELVAVQGALAEERQRRQVLEQTLRHTENQARAEVAAADARHLLARRELEARLANAADRLSAVAADTQAMQARLEEAQTAGSTERARIIEGLQLGHAVVTASGELVRCNHAFAVMFGFASSQEAVARAAGAPFPGLVDHARLAASLETGDTVAQVESTARRLDGRPFRIRTAATRLGSAPGDAGAIERVCLDLSDRQHLEGQLRLARRLEAVGRLVAEMASEIEPLLDRLDAGGHDASSTERRLAVLVRQLLTFGRRQARPAGYLSLNDIVRRQESSLRHVLAETVSLELDLTEIEAVAAGEDDLTVLVATLVHAAAACLPYGGTVRIGTALDTDELILRTRLTVVGTGYGVHSSSLASSLERLASRCGGTFRTSSEPDHSISLHVHFPC